MPAHRRTEHRGRRALCTAAIVLVVGGAVATTMTLTPDTTATANPAEEAAPTAALVPQSTPTPLPEPRIDGDAAFRQIMTMAGYPTDPDTTAFVDSSVTAICADLAAGRTGLDILAAIADETRSRGWSDEQSDGLVYIGVAAQCSAYSYLLP